MRTQSSRGLALILALPLLLAAHAPSGGDGVSASPPLPPSPRLIALGTAQDGGFPQVACSCDRCAHARRDPRLGRKVASLALQVGTQVYVIDATPDLPEQIEAIHALEPARPRPLGKTDRNPVDGILLTHAHIGHYLGLAWLGFETLHSRGTPVHASPRMAAFLRSNGPWSQLVTLGNIELREITLGTPFELVAGVRVTAIQVPHRDEFSDTVAFVIRGPARTVLYVPDTDTWTTWAKPLPQLLDDEKIDLAIVDGTFYSRDELPDRDPAKIGHPLITATMDLLGERVKSGKLAVYFTHLNHSNPANLEGPAKKSIEERGFHVLADGDSLPL